VPCQEWCRYSAGALTAVSCVQVPAGALSGVVQVPAGALSGVVQVPRRRPVRSGAGTRRCPVRSSAQIGLLSLSFPGCIIRRHSTSTRVPHREGNSMGGVPLLTVGIRNRQGCRERQSFCLNWESTGSVSQ